MVRIIFISLIICIVVGGILNYSMKANQKSEELGRFATRDEIVGYWELVQWTDDAKSRNRKNPWPLPYQYFAFYKDGGMTYKMSNESSPTTQQDLDKVRKSSRANISYVLRADGMMLVTRTDMPNYKELWGVNLITKAFSGRGVDFLPGDLVMSLDDGYGQVVYRRHLRRIPTNK